jgi:hypothetical protein
MSFDFVIGFIVLLFSCFVPYGIAFPSFDDRTLRSLSNLRNPIFAIRWHSFASQPAQLSLRHRPRLRRRQTAQRNRHIIHAPTAS